MAAERARPDTFPNLANRIIGELVGRKPDGQEPAGPRQGGWPYRVGLEKRICLVVPENARRQNHGDHANVAQQSRTLAIQQPEPDIYLSRFIHEVGFVSGFRAGSPGVAGCG